MSRMIFINLPVQDLVQSMAFYQALGFENNPKFTDETAACMVLSDAIHVMLLTHSKWHQFTQRPIPPSSTSEVMLALRCDSRSEADRLADIAASQGGIADINPLQDHGFMYSRSLADPDGHIWEMFWMDEEAIPPAE